jgi:hypothetical protein
MRYPAGQKMSAGSGWNGGDGYFYHEITTSVNFTTYYN